ncbi:MAG: cell division protein ZapA [Clostridia bacterium]|nr:cell division protein ZapA [Clostridia bacterium]
MKQKYTLSIADVELNVTVDESPETVEYIVGVIDRKMREILLKSKYCPKTTAALLCALDLCADKVKAKEEIEALRDELAALEERVKKEEEKNRRAEGLTVALEKDKARLEIENMKLRAAIEEAQKTGNIPEIKADEESVAAEPVQEEKEPVKKAQSKSRVGSMFDLLTFSDI